MIKSELTVDEIHQSIAQIKKQIEDFKKIEKGDNKLILYRKDFLETQLKVLKKILIMKQRVDKHIRKNQK